MMPEDFESVLVRWLRYYELKKFGDDIIRDAKINWVEVKDENGNIKGYLKVFNNREGVYIDKWFSKSGNLAKELMNILSEPIEEIDGFRRIISGLNGYSGVELEFRSDGTVSTPYGFLTWFHGQDLINQLLTKYCLELARDYDGETRIKVYVKRPYTFENVKRAIKIVSEGLRIYLMIKKIQEAEALKTTLAIIPCLNDLKENLS